jgi:hypothetical protein
MSRIIAGRFQTSTDAEQAARALTEHSIATERVSIFYVTPPGQHDATPIGGDEYESPGLEESPEGAGVTGAAVGVGAGIAGALIGATAGLATPMVVIAGVGAAAAGAFGGSLAGAMGASDDAGQHLIRHAGMLVAVDAGPDEDKVVAVLRQAGALDIESADGTWVGGTWDDFDPTVAPHLVDGPRPMVANPDGVN